MIRKGIWGHEIRDKGFLILYVSLFLYPLIPLSAQRFEVGFFGGSSTSQVDGDTYSGYNKAGLFTGGSVGKRFSPEGHWSASFEITYIQKGSRKIPRPDKGDFTGYFLKLDYAEVPLLIKYAFTVPDSSTELGARIKFQLEAGIAIGTLVRSEEYDSFGAVSGGTPFQKSDYSTLLGLNYFLSDHFGINVRTEYSVVPVRRGGASSYYQNWTNRLLRPGYYNNLILFSVRYNP